MRRTADKARGPVSSVPDQDLANRLSPMQRAILAVLKDAPRPVDQGDGSHRIGDLPRTGDIVDALGRARDKAGFAAVSRSLDRLVQLGAVEALAPSVLTRGKGRHWLITDAGCRGANSSRPVITRRQAAAIMNVSVSTVYAASRMQRLADEQDRPEIPAAVMAGTLSLHAALKALDGKRPPVGAGLRSLRRAWAKATADERNAFLDELAGEA